MRAIVGLAGSLALVTSAVAIAEVKVCNEFAQPVFVAIGWMENGDTQTQGWWQVNARQCVIVDKRTLQSPHYFHAETSWQSDGHGSKSQHTWGKGKTLAVGADNFKYVHAQNVEPNDNRAEFADLAANVTGFKSVTYVIKADGIQVDKTYRPD